MNVITQFPIVDCRAFLHKTNKLPKPYFVSPDIENNEYIRYFGAMKGRHFQEYHYCTGENAFCNASHAFRFSNLLFYYEDRTIARIKRSERRFYSDGNVLGKFEVKCVYKFQQENILCLPQDTFDHLLDLHFYHDVKICNPKGNTTAHAFLKAGPALANLYLHGSTPYNSIGNVKKYWVQNGQPIIVAEFRLKMTNKFMTVPVNAKKVIITDDWLWDDEYLNLYHYDHNGTPCWIIEMNSNTETAKAISRNLKTLLLRIHAEKQSIIKALEFLSINKDNTEVDSRKAVSFVRNTLNRLLRERRFNLPQGSIVNAAFAADDAFSQNDYTKLRQILLDINNKYIIEDFDCLFSQVDFDELCKLYKAHIEENGSDSIPGDLWQIEDVLYEKDKFRLKKFLEKNQHIINGCKSSALFEALKWIGSTAFTAIVQ